MYSYSFVRFTTLSSLCRIYAIHFGDRYHIELVKVLACCTMGKNVYTEIKCHTLLPLNDIVSVVSHADCIPEVSY